MVRDNQLRQQASVHPTRRVYNLSAPLYPLSSLLFHRRAHQRLMELAGNLDGQKVIDVAAGSGELFRQLLKVNPGGLTVGVDLSPAMMTKVRKSVRKSLNGRRGHNGHNGNGRRFHYGLQIADARHMPFRDGSLDSLFNCYLLELLPAGDLPGTLSEFRRVLKPGGRMLFTLISDESPDFNLFYNAARAAMPAFWGPLIASRMPEYLEQQSFRILHCETVKQAWYPTLITVAERC